MNKKKNVLLNIPNCVGYVRIFLLLCSSLQDQHGLFLLFVSFSALLDMIDGVLARRFHQESAFGEWLDVTIDLFTRAYIWNMACPRFAFLIFGFEFSVFVCTHASGREWQSKQHVEMHWLAKWTVQKGFKTVPGFIAITGLWVTPFWFYVKRFDLQFYFLCKYIRCFSCATLTMFVTFVLVLCRCVCLFVEVCFVHNHLLLLLNQG